MLNSIPLITVEYLCAYKLSLWEKNIHKQDSIRNRKWGVWKCNKSPTLDFNQGCNEYVQLSQMSHCDCDQSQWRKSENWCHINNHEFGRSPPLALPVWLDPVSVFSVTHLLTTEYRWSSDRGGIAWIFSDTKDSPKHVSTYHLHTLKHVTPRNVKTVESFPLGLVLLMHVINHL